MREPKEEEESVSGLSIGQIANKTGTSVETLRYYEKFGLLAAPKRTSANYRLFPQETIRVVKFIKKAQDLGFTLKDIKQLLYLYNSPDADDEDVKAISLALLKDIDTRINTLNTMRTSLGELVAQCAGEHPVKLCPILNALDISIREPVSGGTFLPTKMSKLLRKLSCHTIKMITPKFQIIRPPVLSMQPQIKPEC